MLSPFLRGSAAVMAHDLRNQPSVGIAVEACGDCTYMNFGAFATPEENILFDINDFDVKERDRQEVGRMILAFYVLHRLSPTSYVPQTLACLNAASYSN